MTSWDVFTARQGLPPGMVAELDALRAALPAYGVLITSNSPRYRFEATRRGGGPGPYCVISSDPADLWRELAGQPRPAALDGDDVDRALLMARLTISACPAGTLPPVPPCSRTDDGLPQRAPSGAPVPGGNREGVVRDYELLRRVHRGLTAL